ncbi:MAG: sensor histidine kinase [Pseudomonadota bacterium]
MTPDGESRDASGDFACELIDVNLRRIPWLLVASMPLSLWPLAAYWKDVAMGGLRLVLIADLVSAGLFLALNGVVRRLPGESPWRAAYVWTAVVLALAYMDGYHFLVERSFGASPVYILGVIMAGTIFLLPPRRFLPLLVGNHLVYCADVGWTEGTLPALIENTTGATIAGLVSVLLYRARREEFLQRRALAVANHVLAETNAQLNDLMAITAHDLRSPLLGMRDLVALAIRSAPTGRMTETLGVLARTCGELIALVNRLLDAHSAEQRALTGSELQVADVAVLVRSAVDRIRPRAGGRSIDLRMELPQDAVLAAVDPAALGQVLDNLLANAVKFSPAAATVLIRLSGGPQDDGAWRCDVIDAGPGVAPADRERLFQKFRRGGTPAASGDAGTGLGLFIAASLMKAMGGRIEHAPVEPHGSRFTMVGAGAAELRP